MPNWPPIAPFNNPMEQNNAPFQITAMRPVTTFITRKQITDLLCSALEGGSNYWFSKRPDWGNLPELKEREDCPHKGKPIGEVYTDMIEWADENGHDWSIFITDEDGTECALTMQHFLDGAKCMAHNWPTHFENAFVVDNADADTADVFLQCSIYATICYG